MATPFKLKISEDISAVSGTLHQMDMSDIYRAFPPRAPDYTFFSSTQGTFSRPCVGTQS